MNWTHHYHTWSSLIATLPYPYLIFTNRDSLLVGNLSTHWLELPFSCIQLVRWSRLRLATTHLDCLKESLVSRGHMHELDKTIGIGARGERSHQNKSSRSTKSSLWKTTRSPLFGKPHSYLPSESRSLARFDLELVPIWVAKLCPSLNSIN